MARPIGSASKAKILSAVERLIATSGINRFSLRDVAREAKLSLGTIHYHFATKDDVVFAIMTKHIDELKDEYHAWLLRHQTDMTPDRFLEVIFHKGVRLFNRARMHLFIINQCMSDNVELKTRFLEKYEEWHRELRAGISLAFPESGDKDAMAAILLTIIDGLVVQEALKMPRVGQERIIQIVKRMGEST